MGKPKIHGKFVITVPRQGKNSHSKKGDPTDRENRRDWVKRALLENASRLDLSELVPYVKIEGDNAIIVDNTEINISDQVMQYLIKNLIGGIKWDWEMQATDPIPNKGFVNSGQEASPEGLVVVLSEYQRLGAPRILQEKLKRLRDYESLVDTPHELGLILEEHLDTLSTLRGSREEFEEKTKALQDNEKRVQELQSTVSLAGQRNEGLEAEKQNLEVQLTKAESDLEEERKARKLIEESIHTQIQDPHVGPADAQDTQTTIVELNRKLGFTRSLLDETRAKEESQRKEYSDLRRHAFNEDVEHRMHVRTLDRNVRLLQDELDRIQEVRQKEMETYETTKAQLRTLQSKIREQKTYEREIEELQETNSCLKRQNSQISQVHATLLSEYKALEEARGQTQTEADSLRDQIETSTNRQQEIEAQLSEAIQEIETYKISVSEADKRQQEIGQLRARILEVSKSNEALTSKLEGATTRLKKFSSDRARLEEQLRNSGVHSIPFEQLIIEYIRRIDNDQYQELNKRFDLANVRDYDAAAEAFTCDEKEVVLTRPIIARLNQLNFDHITLALEEIAAEVDDRAKEFERSEFYKGLIVEYLGAKLLEADIEKFRNLAKGEGGELPPHLDLGPERQGAVNRTIEEYEGVSTQWPLERPIYEKIKSDLEAEIGYYAEAKKSAEEIQTSKPLKGELTIAAYTLIDQSYRTICLVLPTNESTKETKFTNFVWASLVDSVSKVGVGRSSEVNFQELNGATFIKIPTESGTAEYNFDIILGRLKEQFDKTPMHQLLGLELRIRNMGEHKNVT